MLNEIINMFSYSFMVRALVVGILISLCAALLGVCLVLKRYSMIGDGLSHVGFGALAVAAVTGLAPLIVAVPVVIITAVLLLHLSSKGKIKGDSATALISTASLAFGVFIISVTNGVNTDLFNYMFGSLLAMREEDVWLSIILAVVVIALFVFFYNKIFAVTFDETFAKATGTKSDFYSILISCLTAITVVLGMRMMGSLLISSLIVLPALTSMRLFKSFKSVTISSSVISVLCMIAGLIVSYCFSAPAGASVVMVNLALFIIFWIISLIKK